MFDLHGAPTGVYKRASRDTAVGTQMEGMSVEGQEEEAIVRTDELGLKVVDIYNDNNLSGSPFRQKERTDWPRMLADIAAGRLRVIVMWDTSRGSRDLEDWVQFLKLIAKHEVFVHAVSHERTYNPNNHRDWQVLAEDGVKNAAFSMQLSTNVKRGFKRSARAGRPRGTAAFGWKRVYDPDSGKMLTQVPVEEHRKHIEEAFTRFTTGTSRTNLAVEWNWRNKAPEDHPNWVPLSRDGHPWRHDSLTHLLRNPVHIGKLRDRATGDLVEGNWDAILDEGLWWSAQRLMDANATHKDPRAKYFLTMIARCGRCDSRMNVKKGRYYVCCGKFDDGSPTPQGSGCTGIRMDWLDDMVLDELAERLADKALAAKLTETNSEQQAAADARAKELRTELDTAWAKVITHEPGYSHDRVAQMEAAWTPEINRLEEEASAGLDAASELARSFHRGAEAAGIPEGELVAVMRDAVEETPLVGQRELVRKFITQIRVLPSKRRGSKVRDPSRVEIL